MIWPTSLTGVFHNKITTFENLEVAHVVLACRGVLRGDGKEKALTVGSTSVLVRELALGVQLNFCWIVAQYRRVYNIAFRFKNLRR